MRKGSNNHLVDTDEIFSNGTDFRFQGTVTLTRSEKNKEYTTSDNQGFMSLSSEIAVQDFIDQQILALHGMVQLKTQKQSADSRKFTSKPDKTPEQWQAEIDAAKAIISGLDKIYCIEKGNNFINKLIDVNVQKESIVSKLANKTSSSDQDSFIYCSKANFNRVIDCIVDKAQIDHADGFEKHAGFRSKSKLSTFTNQLQTEANDLHVKVNAPPSNCCVM